MNLFDMIGPVMIGPSSSHTAGAARLGAVALTLLGEPVAVAEITLYGSFAKTYRGHGTDKALVAGLLGFAPDDTRLRKSYSFAEKEGLIFTFITAEGAEYHPNTAFFRLTGKSGQVVTVRGASVGGGAIVVEDFCDMNVRVTGELPTLIVLHHDTPGVIAAVSETLASHGVNIAAFRLSREGRGERAVMSIETDSDPERSALLALETLPEVLSVTHISLPKSK